MQIAMQSLLLATIGCLSVCLSLCHTLVLSQNDASYNQLIMKSSPTDSPRTLVLAIKSSFERGRQMKVG